MDEIKILTNEELELYDEFSLSFNPKTKKDYLLKNISLFSKQSFLFTLDVYSPL